MPSKPRADVFDPDEVGAYHCWNRLVQRRHLFVCFRQGCVKSWRGVG